MSDDDIKRLLDDCKRMAGRNDRLWEQLELTCADLGAALGIALVALEDPELAIRQLDELVGAARHRAGLKDGEVLAPHWRTTAAVLAAKTKKTTTGPGLDATNGGAR